MSAEANVIDKAKGLISGRLAELEEEQKRLNRALSAITGNGKPAPASLRRRSKGSKPKQKASKNGKRSTRRGETRLDEAVKMVENFSSGLSAKDIAKAMGIKPNYLYRVLDQAVKQKRIRKDGLIYYPAG